MERYLVETPHTAKECNKILEQFMFHGFINHFDWGCKVGVHIGWATLEAENESQALMAVPPLLRSQARAIRLTKFTPDMIQKDHE